MKHLIILSLVASITVGFPDTRNGQRSPLAAAVDKASMRMLQEVFTAAEDKNVIVSPLGVLTLLSMYSEGTEGKIREEIMQLLGFTNYTQEDLYSSLIERFVSMDPSYLVLANKIYVSDKCTLVERFSEVVSRSYKSQVEQVDFVQRQKTANIINKWANEKTNGHINSIVNENMFDDNTALALLNAIFFQGHWHVPFNAKDTEMKNFYVRRRVSVKKPMMKLREHLAFYDNNEIEARVLELPYKEKGFRMVVVLPYRKNGLPVVLETLAQRGLLDDVFTLSDSDKVVEVMLEMPKFEIRNKIDLKTILPKLGVSRIFNEGARNLVQGEQVMVSEALQEAFVTVDEEGATAGGVTAAIVVLLCGGCSPPPVQFKVDHPFMFAILHEDVVLFTGTYSH